MKHIRLLPLFLVALCLAACGGGSTGASADAGASGSSLRVSVTDAPFPSAFVEEATVVIREVRIRNADTEAWETIYSGNAEIDLIPLTGGVAELLVDANPPPGTYDEVRLIVEAGRVRVADGVVTASGEQEFTVANGTLKFPSGAQTGIKVKIENSIEVTTGLSAELMLDFDLTKSFVFNGSPSHPNGVRRVLFKPVIRASNTSVAGTLRLTALSDAGTPVDTADDVPLPGATVRICNPDGTEFATAMADATGVAQLALPAGTYDVKIEAAAHESTTTEDVAVALANTTDLGEVALTLSEAEIRGTVRSDMGTAADATDDLPVSGATIEVRAAGTPTVLVTATTDAQGAFVIEQLAPGAYDLRVSQGGFLTLDVGAVSAAAPGAAVPQDLVLTALQRDVKGTVTDNVAAAAAGATVEILDAAGSSLGLTTTDAAGAYTLLDIPTGAHTLRVTPSGSTTSVDQALSVTGTDPKSDLTADVALP